MSLLLELRILMNRGFVGNEAGIKILVSFRNGNRQNVAFSPKRTQNFRISIKFSLLFAEKRRNERQKLFGFVHSMSMDKSALSFLIYPNRQGKGKAEERQVKKCRTCPVLLHDSNFVAVAEEKDEMFGKKVNFPPLPQRIH